MSSGTTPGADADPDPTIPSQVDPAPEPSAAAATPLPRIEGVRLQGVIARGGMGVVYRGVQEYLDRPVAVKVLAPHLQNEDFVARFQREARILSGISHPNIVLCYQAGMTDKGLCFMVMEYVDGTTLRRHTENRGPLAPADAVWVCRDLARALEHAHAAGVIHRDVKPDNVLLQPSTAAARDDPFPYVPKLVDLGIARTARLADGLTAPGMVIGTHSTMAPEQFDDPDHVDFRADIYGLGCVLYHSLTGEPAFPSSPLTKVMEMKRQALGPDPRERVPDIPEGTAELTRRMMAAARRQRPGSYAAVIAACEKQLAAATSVSAKAGSEEGRTTITSLSRRDAPWAKRRQRTGTIVAVVVAAIVLAGLTVGLLLWAPWQRQAAPPPPAGGSDIGERPEPGSVDVAPVLAIDAPPTVAVGGTLRLEARIDDPDSPGVSCAWEQVGGPTVPLKIAGRLLTVAPVTLLPQTELEFAATVDDGVNDAVVERVKVEVVAGGEALFPDDPAAPLEGWTADAAGSWLPYDVRVVNGRANTGETALERPLPDDGFTVTGELELMPEFGQDRFAEAAGLRLLSPGRESLVLWIEAGAQEVSSAFGGQGEAAAWPPQAMGSKLLKETTAEPVLRFAVTSLAGRVTLIWSVGGAPRRTVIERPEGGCRLQLFVREGLGRFYDLRLALRG